MIHQSITIRALTGSLLVFTAAGPMASCKRQVESPPRNQCQTRTPGDTSVLYNLECAQEDVRLYRKMYNEILYKNPDTIVGTDAHIYSYTMSRSDVVKAFGASPNFNSLRDYCRAYIGFNRQQGFKLFIVPVDGANPEEDKPGVDRMLTKDGAIDTGANTPPSELRVLDLISPCPKLCDERSPLMKNMGGTY